MLYNWDPVFSFSVFGSRRSATIAASEVDAEDPERYRLTWGGRYKSEKCSHALQNVKRKKYVNNNCVLVAKTFKKKIPHNFYLFIYFSE